MEDKIYKFECNVEYEKFFSEDSFFGCYNVTTKDNVPKGQLYKGNEFDGYNTETIYFLNLAGKMQRLYLGCKYNVTATLEFNKKYNSWQYVPKTLEPLKPKGTEDTKRFLDTILKENQTNALLEHYPNIVDDVISGREIDLTHVHGIKEKSFAKIKEKIINTYSMSELLMMLQPLGITFNTIQKIYSIESNVEVLKKMIKKNPYILTRIRGLGFKKVDNIAMKINPDIRVSRERLIAFLDYYFVEMGNKDGHTYCEFAKLDRDVKSQLNDCYDIFLQFIENEKENPKYLFMGFEGLVGLMRYYNTEKSILEILNDIDKYSQKYSNNPKINYERSMEKTEKRLGFSLTEEQKYAVESTLDNGVTIITAKSGSGKTTCLNGIVDLYKDTHKIAMCSLSAKASRRMTEATNQEASTIHKLLGYGKGNKELGELYEYNANNRLPHDIVIIDEATMINAEIFLALLRAINPLGKVVIVFDNGQLPPIGYANVANDLLSSDFNICTLTKVHRQAEASGILTDGNKIREQICPIDKPVVKEIHGELNDLCYMFREDRTQMRNILIKSYLKYVEELGIENAVIIVPRKDTCTNSCAEINIIIQDELIKNDVPFINRGDMKFKLGARVIQKTNNYDKGVVNGELGFIVDIWKDDENKEHFKVKFDDEKIVAFDRMDISDIQLSYALTCHSYQGSEIHTALVCVDNTHYSLLSSNWLYTAITRAKKRCLLVAEPSAFQMCIKNKLDNKRKTFLSLML